MPMKIEPGNYKDVDFSKCVVLQSNDQIEFVVERDAAEMSVMIKTMLENEHTIIPISNVNGRTLEYVLEYCEHHWNNRPDPIDKPLLKKIDDVISPWDRKFIWTDLVKGGDEKQHELLMEVMTAANFLNIKDLLDLTCATIASLLKGKTTEQMRVLFGTEGILEEEEMIQEENRWCDEA